MARGLRSVNRGAQFASLAPPWVGVARSLHSERRSKKGKKMLVMVGVDRWTHIHTRSSVLGSRAGYTRCGSVTRISVHIFSECPNNTDAHNYGKDAPTARRE